MGMFTMLKSQHVLWDREAIKSTKCVISCQMDEESISLKFNSSSTSQFKTFKAVVTSGFQNPGHICGHWIIKCLAFWGWSVCPEAVYCEHSCWWKEETRRRKKKKKSTFGTVIQHLEVINCLVLWYFIWWCLLGLLVVKDFPDLWGVMKGLVVSHTDWQS